MLVVTMTAMQIRVCDSNYISRIKSGLGIALPGKLTKSERAPGHHAIVPQPLAASTFHPTSQAPHCSRCPRFPGRSRSLLATSRRELFILRGPLGFHKGWSAGESWDALRTSRTALNRLSGSRQVQGPHAVHKEDRKGQRSFPSTAGHTMLLLQSSRPSPPPGCR